MRPVAGLLAALSALLSPCMDASAGPLGSRASLGAETTLDVERAIELRRALERPSEQAAAILGRQGRELVAPVFAVIRDGRWPEAACTSPAHRLLTKADWRTLLDALALVRDPHLDQFLEAEVLSKRATTDDRITALRILSEIGTARELPLALRISAEPMGRLQRAADHWFEAAISGILGRDAAGFQAVLNAWDEALTPAQRPCVLRAIKATQSPQGLELLIRLLDTRSAPQLELLTDIHRLAEQLAVVPESVDLLRIRGLLNDRDPEVRASAALCLGRLHDAEAMPALIELLHDLTAQVSQHSLTSLRLLTGRGFDAEPDRWQTWYRAELAWWSTAGRETLGELRSMDKPTAITAILETGQHRLFAGRYVAELCRLLRAPDAEIRRTACAALALSWCGSAVPHLVEALDDPEEAVRVAALGALRSLTGDAELTAAAAREL